MVMLSRNSSLLLKAGLFTFVLLLLASTSDAQKRYSYNSQIWLSYFTQLRLSNKFGIAVDGSLRTKDHMVEDLSQILVRAGATWFITEDIRATVGYVFSDVPANELHHLTNRIEYRPYEMIQWVKNAGRYRFVQTGRLEQRFRQRILNGDLGDGYNFVQRARLNSMVMRSLSANVFAPRTFSLSAGLELFYNFGKEVMNNGFDQLRAQLNVQYHLNGNNTLTAGYLYQVQQFGKGDGYNKLNAVRFNFIHQLDLRKIKS